MSRVLSSVPVVAQLVGGAAALCGVFLLLGLAWTLVAGGVVVVVLGSLFEGGRL